MFLVLIRYLACRLPFFFCSRVSCLVPLGLWCHAMLCQDRCRPVGGRHAGLRGVKQLHRGLLRRHEVHRRLQHQRPRWPQPLLGAVTAGDWSNSVSLGVAHCGECSRSPHCSSGRPQAVQHLPVFTFVFFSVNPYPPLCQTNLWPSMYLFLPRAVPLWLLELKRVPVQAWTFVVIVGSSLTYYPDLNACVGYAQHLCCVGMCRALRQRRRWGISIGLAAPFLPFFSSICFTLCRWHPNNWIDVRSF